MSDKPIYITIMRRWGDEESHHYIIGAYSDLADATLDGLIHADYRAEKYEPTVFETALSTGPDKIHSVIKVSKNTAVNYAKLKYPERFDDLGKLKESGDE